jgi:hypothetical protein
MQAPPSTVDLISVPADNIALPDFKTPESLVQVPPLNSNGINDDPEESIEDFILRRAAEEKESLTYESLLSQYNETNKHSASKDFAVEVADLREDPGIQQEEPTDKEILEAEVTKHLAECRNFVCSDKHPPCLASAQGISDEDLKFAIRSVISLGGKHTELYYILPLSMLLAGVGTEPNRLHSIPFGSSGKSVCIKCLAMIFYTTDDTISGYWHESKSQQNIG